MDPISPPLVTAKAGLLAVQGHTLNFRVSCRDQAGPIGAGTHARAIIDVDKFLARLSDKKARA